MNELNKYSKTITQDPTQPAAQAMLYGIGLTDNDMKKLNKYRKTITQPPTQPAAQAMLYGIGLTDNDMKKAQVGIVSMGYDGNTCNMHLNDLAADVKKGVWDNDLVGLIFNTIGVSDGT